MQTIEEAKKKNIVKDNVRLSKIMVILGSKNPDNYNLISDLDILLIREGKGQNRSEKILELIRREVREKRGLINGSPSTN